MYAEGKREIGREGGNESEQHIHVQCIMYVHGSVDKSVCLVCRMLRVRIPPEATHVFKGVVFGHSCLALPCLVD